MNEFSERLLSSSRRRDRAARTRALWLIAVPLIAILFQLYVPRYLHFLAYLELPLLVTVHFALTRREGISSGFYGAAIGLVQDSLSNHPLRMLCTVKTVVG